MENGLFTKEDLSGRIKILDPEEISAIYGLPKLSLEMKDEYFELTERELGKVNHLKSVGSKVCFILQLGYFKARKRFFDFAFNYPSIREDVDYIFQRYFPKAISERIHLSKANKGRQKKIILKLCSYKDNKGMENKIENKIKDLVSIDANPKYIFNEVCRFTEKEQIILPSYKWMQLMVSKYIVREENRIYSFLEELLDINLIFDMQRLLNKEDGKRYLLTIIKRSAKGFSYSEVSSELEKQKVIKPIYFKATQIFKKLKLSNSTISYYATVVSSYTIDQLKQLSYTKQYFYVLCFVFYRYLRVNDDLITTFISLISKYKNDVKKAVDEIILQATKENKKNLKKVSELLNLFLDEDLNEISFKDIKSKAYNILSREEIEKLSDYLSKMALDNEAFKWKEYDKKYNTIKRNIRRIFTALDFSQNNTKNTSLTKLLNAIEYLQQQFRTGDNNYENLALDFIPGYQLSYMYEDRTDKRTGETEKKLSLKRYEIFIYNQLKDRINNSDIFIYDSMSYNSLNNILLEQKEYEENKEDIGNSLNLCYLKSDFEQLIENELVYIEAQIEEVNHNILNGTLSSVSPTSSKNGWKLDYECVENELINNPIFYSIPEIDLPDLLNFVQSKTNFLSAFTHLLNRYAKRRADEINLMGTLIGYGVNLGPRKMASSSTLSEYIIRQTASNFLRPETLKRANEIIVNAIAKLPIFEYYNIAEDIIHSSSDGQKLAMAVAAINSRYSSKYLGTDKGISNLTLIANYLPVASKIIGANEYEGNHLLDLLLMNDSMIQPHFHSTDTHGVNQINFALLHLCGFNFAPRYRSLNNRSNIIFGTKSLKEYNDNYLIKPSGKINKEIILSSESEIKRIIASIMLKTAPASTIVNKLVHFPDSNKMKKSFVEVDKIFRTKHSLNYIADMNYRQNIQVALNRGEAYHQLQNAVSLGNGGKLIAKTEWDQTIYKETTRLICNCIIYHNSYILSRFLNQKIELEELDQVEALKRVSPIAYVNINFTGKYDFNKKFDPKFLEKIDDLIKEQKLIVSSENIDSEKSQLQLFDFLN